MIKLHVTKKLSAKLTLDDYGCLPGKSTTPEALIQEENLLSGWHANLITIQRRNCVIFIHDETRFPLFAPCLKKPDFANLNYWFVDSYMNTLLKCGASHQQMEQADSLLQPLVIDTLCNRSVQGTMNQMAGDVQHMLRYDRVDVVDLAGYSVGAWLAERPCSIKGRPQGVWPIRDMLAMLTL